MGEKRNLKRLLASVNYIRTLPVYLCILTSGQRKLIEMDLARWQKISADEMGCGGFLESLNWLLTYRKEFRNLILHRLKKPPTTIRSLIHFVIARVLWKPLDSLYLWTHDIGGGLFIQHGFSTVISAERIGENCWINQQVTIGYSGDQHPIIEDNVTICCGAKIIGGVTMKRNSTAGAGAVVVHDVPENAIVGGVPAKVIKMKE